MKVAPSIDGLEEEETGVSRRPEVAALGFPRVAEGIAPP